MSYRIVKTETFPVEGGACTIHRLGSAQFVGRAGEGYDGTVFLSAYDVAEILRRCAGSDGEALRILSHVMLNGHRFTDLPIPPDNATLEPF